MLQYHPDSRVRWPALAWWAILCPPLFTFAVWRAAWWQWRLPAEDGALENLEGLVAFGLSAGIILGVVASRSARDWRLVRRSGAGLVALGACELLLTALLDGSRTCSTACC
jgi:hypothetical protein